MATTQEVLDAVGAAEARVAGNITAAIADLQVKLDTGAALTAADLDKVLAAVNGIGATPPAPV